MEINKIYLGNCYELIKLIPDKSIDCIYTDVPYLIQSGGKGGGAFGDRMDNLLRNKMRDIIEGFDYNIFDDFIRILKKVNIFIWCNKQQIKYIIDYFKDYSMEILVWCKTNPTPFTNNLWLPDVEYCLYFREKNVKLNDGYEIKSKFFVSPLNKGDKDLYNHPTIKPYKFVMNHLLHATNENDIILDPFNGSGTTCCACKEINRNYLGFENNLEYFNTSIDRINGITVKERINKDNGMLDIFDFMEEKNGN